MAFSGIASLTVSIISAAVATVAFIVARLDPKPKIKGQVNTILHSPLGLPDGREITALMLHVTLTNSTKNPAHVMSYRLEIDRGRGREELPRLKRLYAFPALTAGDERIILDENVLIYRPPRPVEYGAPLIGVIVFYLEEPGVGEELIKEYKLVVTDVLGNQHNIAYRRGQSPPDGFDSIELFELAGAKVEQVKQPTGAGNDHGESQNGR
jgi:hypothetical protein